MRSLCSIYLITLINILDPTYIVFITKLLML